MWKTIERLLWIVAAVTLGISGLVTVERWFYQSRLDRQFEEVRERAVFVPPAIVPAADPEPVAESAALPRGAIGRLVIPSIQLSAMIAEGVDARTLRRSVGHIPGTSLPGAKGKIGLSAHRDTFFRRLGSLHKGDAISIETVSGNFQYVVESTSIVNPDDTRVLHDEGAAALTLVTCYPFYYVGPAPKRFVVQARPVR